MATDPRVIKAFDAMSAIGVSSQQVKPVLKHLLKLFDKKWEYIEEENYRTLKDAYFEFNQNKGKECKRKGLQDEESCKGRPRIPHSADEDGPMLLAMNDMPHNQCNEKLLEPKSEQYYTPPAHSSMNFPGPDAQQVTDITKGTEKVKISLVDHSGIETIPMFNYIPQNLIYQSANLNISLARIADEDCCSQCAGDCLSTSIPCACARETGGEFAYTKKGLLKENFLNSCLCMRRKPQDHHFVYCEDCPLERAKNEYMPQKCTGHLVRKFIKECWRKCGCDMSCGNRVVQRGLTCNLQVFFTREGKGWGLRTLEALPKGTFVCEYVGEILTNTELYERNVLASGNERHTYPVTLDADWGSEGVLKDEEALCLDATYHGNVARFINHRCNDANLVDIPVEVESPDRHYYHVAFFTSRNVDALEELTWDYEIDFDDQEHPIKAFKCCCKSRFCRDKKRKGKRKLETVSKQCDRD